MLEHEYWSTGVNGAFVFLLLFLCFLFGCYFTGVINVLGEWIRGRRNNDNHRLRRWIHTFNNKQLVAFLVLLFSVIVGVEFSVIVGVEYGMNLIPLVCIAANQGFTAATNSVNAKIYSFVSPVDVTTTPSFYGDGDTGTETGHVRKHDGNSHIFTPSSLSIGEEDITNNNYPYSPAPFDNL